jgi:hypothetical protein
LVLNPSIIFIIALVALLYSLYLTFKADPGYVFSEKV